MSLSLRLKKKVFFLNFFVWVDFQKGLSNRMLISCEEIKVDFASKTNDELKMKEDFFIKLKSIFSIRFVGI